MNWERLLSVLPRLAVSMLPGIMMGGPLAGRAARVLQGAAGKKVPGTSMTYPGLTEDFYYPINFIGGGVNAENGSLDRAAAQNGALAQSLEEHNKALVSGGPAAEKALESWWPGQDNTPRVNFGPSSSAVSGVRILPNNKIQIQFRGGGKWYTYRGGSNPREASEAVKDLLTAPSIGRALPRKGKNAHYMDGRDSHADPNVGFWGRSHYDPNW